MKSKKILKEMIPIAIECLGKAQDNVAFFNPKEARKMDQVINLLNDHLDKLNDEDKSKNIDIRYRCLKHNNFWCLNCGDKG